MEDGRTFAYSVKYEALVLPEEPEHEHIFVKTLVGAEVDCTIAKIPGNTNPYTFVIDLGNNYTS